jgi:hypothetical protein
VPDRTATPREDDWSVSAPAQPRDCQAADFAAGVVNPGVHLATTSAGPELILTPALAAEFGHAGLPPGWFVEPMKEGGTADVGDGRLVLDGANAGHRDLVGSPRSIEFVATFRKRPHQHVGFGTDFRSVPWITFSTKFGNALYARSNFIIPEDNRLAPSLLGSPHRFLIDWQIIEVDFWVDGRRVVHQLVPMVGYMRPLAGSGSRGDPLELEWLRMSPYCPEGSFRSRVHDVGAPARWDDVELDADVPAGTSVTCQVRAGDTARPDESWSPWIVAGAGTATGRVPVRGRFGQYRLRLTTASPSRTPVVRAVALHATPAEGYSSSGCGGLGGTSGA